MLSLSDASPSGNGTGQFDEKSFTDYHLYTMDGRTTLKDNQSKQLRLFGATDIPYRRFYEVAAWSEDAQIGIEL